MDKLTKRRAEIIDTLDDKEDWSIIVADIPTRGLFGL